jgi:hypothetical protein
MDEFSDCKFRVGDVVRLRRRYFGQDMCKSLWRIAKLRTVAGWPSANIDGVDEFGASASRHFLYAVPLDRLIAADGREG